MLDRAFRFFSRDLWRLKLKGKSGPRVALIQGLRILLTAAQRFQADHCVLMASSLTYYSLLSIVPVLAAAFGISRGFGFDEFLRERLQVAFAEQQEILVHAMGYADRLLEQARGGLIAGVGVFFLLWVVIKLLAEIEGSFNRIWQVRKQRSFGRRFSDYLALIIICPLFFTVASSLTVYMASQAELLSQGGGWMGTISPALLALVKFLPYGLLWVLFTFLYLFLPNTRIPFLPGLSAGILTGTGYHILQWIYLKFQIGVAYYGAIYGSFAALPLFLIWLQMSWVLVLVGAEICAASQNLADFEFRHDCSRASQAFRRYASLLIAREVALSFSHEKAVLSREDLGARLELPSRLLKDLSNLLVDAGILSETMGKEGEVLGYQPARPLESLTIASVSEALDHLGSDDIPVRHSASSESLKAKLKELRQLITDSSQNLRLDQL